MKVSKYFDIKELVSPQMYERYGDFCVTFMDERLISLLDVLRDSLGEITINDWSWNDNDLTNYKYSGLRTMIDGNYAVGSQHSFGKAVDIKSKVYSSKDIYNKILSESNYFIKNGLTGLESIEDTPTWVHITVGNYPERKNKLAIIPKAGIITYI